MKSDLFLQQTAGTRRFLSRDGYEIDFGKRSWRLSKDVSIPVFTATEYLNEEMYKSYREVLAFYSRGNAPKYVHLLHYRAMHYFRAMKELKLFSVESLISYRSLLGTVGEPNLAVLRIFIKKWHALGYPGIGIDAVRILERWTLSGGEKGAPVRSMCPETGPLTDIEMDAVISAVIAAYESGSFSVFEASLVMTVIMTGRRPLQITALKICDLKQNSGGYFINVPRAKQRLNGGWRKDFKQVAIVEDLWLLLQAQADSVYQKLCKIINVPLELKENLPLFPAYSALDKSKGLAIQLTGDSLHLRVEVLQKLMVVVASNLKVLSERTGAPIYMNAYRFRYTLGTNLGREGKGEYVIAEALDHSDTQHTGVYVKNLPETAERIDKAVAYQLAPIAQAFQGVVIKSEDEARRGNDPNSRISDGSESVGNCGSHGICGALSPIACYTCNHFQPWLDGPHESVLDRLLRERDRILEITDDLKIASINDRLIIAVADVVCRCENMKKVEHGRDSTI
jgi:integrase